MGNNTESSATKTLTSEEKDRLAAKRATQSVLLILALCSCVIGVIWALFNFLGPIWAIIVMVTFFGVACIWGSAYDRERKKLK